MRLRAILEEAEAEQELRGVPVIRDLGEEAQKALGEVAETRRDFLDFRAQVNLPPDKRLPVDRCKSRRSTAIP